jgi:hypothetical protein
LSVYSRTNAIIEIAKIDFASLVGGASVRHPSTDQLEI